MVKSMLREDPKRHKASEPAQTVHWSVNDMKVAYFQETTPSRNVTQKREWNDFVRSTKETNDVHPGTRHSHVRDVDGRFVFGTVSWTTVR